MDDQNSIATATAPRRKLTGTPEASIAFLGGGLLFMGVAITSLEFAWPFFFFLGAVVFATGVFTAKFTHGIEYDCDGIYAGATELGGPPSFIPWSAVRELQVVNIADPFGDSIAVLLALDSVEFHPCHAQFEYYRRHWPPLLPHISPVSVAVGQQLEERDGASPVQHPRTAVDPAAGAAITLPETPFFIVSDTWLLPPLEMQRALQAAWRAHAESKLKEREPNEPSENEPS